MNDAHIILVQKSFSELAINFHAALQTDDWHKIRNMLSADIVWTLPGSSLLSGVARGRDEVIRRFMNLKAFGVNFGLKYVLTGYSGFTLALHNTASRGELQLDEQVAIVFEISDGLIATMATYLSDVPGIERFFVPGIIES